MFVFDIKLLTRFLMALLIIAISAKATKAQKCKYEKNEIDAITEKIIKRTEPEVLLRLNNSPVYVKTQCIGEFKYLKVTYIKYNGFYILDDREIAFKLNNDQEIILYPRPLPQDTAQTDELLGVTALLIYKLSPEQYQILTSSPVTEFKYFMSTGWMSEEINSNKQNLIMDLLRCVE